jgi:hypothetical protein
MKPPFPAPSLGVPHHRPPWCAHLAPNQQSVSNLGLKVSFLPLANYNRTHLAFVLTNSRTCSRSVSPKPNTIEYA